MTRRRSPVDGILEKSERSNNAKLLANQNVVDGNVHKLDKETNETHDEEPNPCRLGNNGELLSVGLGALLNEVDRVLGELLEGFDENLFKSFLFHSELNWRCNCKR